MKLYIKSGKFFYYGDVLYCSHCEKQIRDIMLFREIYRRSGSELKVYCKDCINKMVNEGTVEQYKLCVVVNSPPKDSRIYIPSPPRLTEGRIDCFQAADPRFNSKLSSDTSACHVIDKAHISRLPDKLRLQQPDSKSPDQVQQLLTEHDKYADSVLSSLNDFMSTLDMIRNSKPVIEHSEKKKLTHQGDNK